MMSCGCPRCYRRTWVIFLKQLRSQGGLPGGVNPCFEFGRIGQSWSGRGKCHVAVKAGQRPKGLSESGLFWKKQLFRGGRSSQQMRRGRQSLLGIMWRKGALGTRSIWTLATWGCLPLQDVSQWGAMGRCSAQGGQEAWSEPKGRTSLCQPCGRWARRAGNRPFGDHQRCSCEVTLTFSWLWPGQ